MRHKVARLSIEIAGNKFDAEGDEGFLRELYNDFYAKLDMLHQMKPDHDAPDVPVTADVEEGEKREIVRKSRKPKAKTAKPSKSNNIEIDHNLKLDGLTDFFENYKPRGNPEVIVVFAAYLRDKHGLEPCTQNQIYTCYWALRKFVKIPRNMRQALIDTKNKKKWLELEGENVRITPMGENALNYEIGQTSSE